MLGAVGVCHTPIGVGGDRQCGLFCGSQDVPCEAAQLLATGRAMVSIQRLSLADFADLSGEWFCLGVVSHVVPCGSRAVWSEFLDRLR